MTAAVLPPPLAGLTPLARGKVRDLYRVDDAHLLFVASDRISAFDVVMATPIVGKGKVLTQLSLFWFERLGALGPHHLVTGDVAAMPASVRQHALLLAGRAMLVKTVRILPIEAIVRGYLAGSGWKEYRSQGTVCGIRLPPNLRESSALPEPLFTPSTKAALGSHDENIHPDQVAAQLGKDRAAELAQRAIALYRSSREYAATRGIIIADTKFEFGLDAQDRLILADEVLTPDSSRFWPAAGYAPGRAQDSFDKQYLRDWLEKIGFDKKTPLELPAEVVDRTLAKYVEAFRLLTGREPSL